MAALAELGVWAIVYVCLGLAIIITAVIVALLQGIANAINTISLGLIPADWVDGIEQACEHAFGVAFGWVDKQFGASLHTMARLLDWTWEQVVHAATGYLLLVELVAKLVYAHSGLKTVVHSLSHSSTAQGTQVKTLEREYEHIRHRVKVLERDYAKGIGEDLLPRIKTLEREADHIENVEIPAAIAAQKQADSAISDLYDWAKGKASLIGVGTFTVAVTAVLSAVGLDWLACRGRSGVNGKAGCALWNDVEALLGAAIVTGLALDLPALIGEAQKATPGIIAGIEDLAGLSR